MIVADASAVLELLLNTDAAEEVGARLLDPAAIVCAPHLLDVEVLQVLRRYALAKELSRNRGRQAVEDLTDLPITRYPHEPFVERIWELRHNLTAYDAAYVALTETLGAVLLTRDRHLAKSTGHRARIEVVR